MDRQLIEEVREVVRLVSQSQGRPEPILLDEEILEALGEIDDNLHAPDSEIERAEAADLISIPDDVDGTRCGNCLHFVGGYCNHPEVRQPVEEKDCCNHWDHPGTLRPWQDV
jgi:hypothetical protein